MKPRVTKSEALYELDIGDIAVAFVDASNVAALFDRAPTKRRPKRTTRQEAIKALRRAIDQLAKASSVVDKELKRLEAQEADDPVDRVARELFWVDSPDLLWDDAHKKSWRALAQRAIELGAKT